MSISGITRVGMFELCMGLNGTRWKVVTLPQILSMFGHSITWLSLRPWKWLTIKAFIITLTRSSPIAKRQCMSKREPELRLRQSRSMGRSLDSILLVVIGLPVIRNLWLESIEIGWKAIWSQDLIKKCPARWFLECRAFLCLNGRDQWLVNLNGDSSVFDIQR